jgi:hypothetical protein
VSAKHDDPAIEPERDEGHAPAVKLPGRMRTWLVLGGVVAILALVRVTIADPRVHVRWGDGVTSGARAALERRYGLYDGRVADDQSAAIWRYQLRDLSSDNIRALIHDPAVVDTAYLNRDTFESEGRDVQVTLRYPYSDLFRSPLDLWRLHRSAWLLLAGGLLLWGAHQRTAKGRRAMTLAMLLLVGVAGSVVPFEPPFVTMGGSADHVRSRKDFEDWWGGRVRFEKHLSQVILLETYQRLEPTEAAPTRAVVTMARGATLWFIVSAVAIAAIEGWSPLVLRYLGLVLLAPSALLYLGWRELGYLSLNVATFPLLVRGLADGGMRIEASGAAAGLGAALHGSGLVSLAGAWLATIAARARASERVCRAMRLAAWGTAAWVGWLAVYLLVLQLPISDAGLNQFSPWRRWTVEDERLGRVAAPIVSYIGARDLSMTAWIVGLPLVPLVVSLRRRYPLEVRSALWYLLPSFVFVLFRWPFEGVGAGIDLVVAGFPALYALAWVCAQDLRRSCIAAALLASAHYAFWRVVLDRSFMP